jgi:quinol monooxygenase YgiN
MPEIVVIATAQAKPGREDEVLAALSGLVGPTHEEEGCILYALHRGIENPAQMAIVERWKSQEALDEHFTRPHMAALGEVVELLEAPPSIVAYEAVPAGREEKSRL